MSQVEDERNDTQRRIDTETEEEKDKPVDQPWETQDQPHEGEEGQDIV
jgi:hypothetical protein